MANSTQRLLCMGDNHGNTSSLERVVEETEGEEFDFIIHVGDITNAYFDGLDEGVEQLKSVEPYLATLAERGEFVYIWGNRDKHRGEHVTNQYPLDIGTHVPGEGTITIAGQEFTQDTDEVNEDTILITHGLDTRLLDFFDGRAYFSGHVHTGRFKRNALNTAFLYRDDSHGADTLEGGYFAVELDESGIVDVEPRLWELKEGRCLDHLCRGIQYVPGYWREDCQFCYDEEDYYNELMHSALYQALSERGVNPETVMDPIRGPSIEDVPISTSEVIEVASDLCHETPTHFDTKLRSYIEEALGTTE